MPLSDCLAVWGPENKSDFEIPENIQAARLAMELGWRMHC